MKLQNRLITSGDLTLWTQRFTSNPSADTCVLISGAGAPAMFWTDEFCQKIVASGFNVIRFDNRDIGLSDPVDWDKNPYSIEDLARDVLNILDAYGIDSAHVVGHSMGGIVAQWLAMQYPTRIKSYTSISVATCGIAGEPPSEIMEVLLENKPTQHFINDLPGFMRSWGILNGNYELDRKLAEKYTQDLYIRSKHKVDVAWHHIWCEQGYLDLTNRLRQITVSGLFIHGEVDPLVPVKAGIETQRQALHSELLIIPGMGHMIFNRSLEDIIANAIITHVTRYSK